MDGIDHVTDEHRQRDELERDEQWFAGFCERTAEIDTTRIKRSVRIAADELWLAGHAPHDVPAGLAARARQAVRGALTEELSGAGNRGRTRVIRAWAWVGGGLAAAAMIGLAVIGAGYLAPTADSYDETINYALAFEEYPDDDELDQELSELRDAFSELDQAVAQGWGDESWEEPVDETSDQAEDGV